MQVAEVSDKWDRLSFSIGNHSRFAIDTIYRRDTVNVLVFQSFASRSKHYKYSIDLNEKLKRFWPLKYTGIYYRQEAHINPIGIVEGDTGVLQVPWESYKEAIEYTDSLQRHFDLAALESKWKRMGKEDLLDSCKYVKVERFEETILPRILFSPPYESLEIRGKIDSIGASFSYKSEVDISIRGGNTEMQLAQLIYGPFQGNSVTDMRMPSDNKDYTTSPWLALYDVSRFDYKLKLPRDCYIESLEIFFMDPCEFLPLYPEPDITTSNTLYYTDIEKIKMLQVNGFHVTVKLPLLENFQNMKIFVLTSLIAFLCTIIFNLLRDLVRNKVERYKNPIGVILFVILLLVIICTTVIIIKLL